MSHQFRLTFTADTTEGPRTLTSDPGPLGETLDHTAGVIAAIGEEFVISLKIERDPA